MKVINATSVVDFRASHQNRLQKYVLKMMNLKTKVITTVNNSAGESNNQTVKLATTTAL